MAHEFDKCSILFHWLMLGPSGYILYSSLIYPQLTGLEGALTPAPNTSSTEFSLLIDI